MIIGYSQRCLALLQSKQRRYQARARHTGVKADLRNDQSGQLSV